LSHLYIDSSALVKRYVHETGSEWLTSQLVPIPEFSRFTSRLSIVEVISAFARRMRDGSLSQDQFSAARDAFRDDCLYEYRIVSPTQAIIDHACTMLERHPLRAFDAAHLATALIVEQFLAIEGDSPLSFISADERLNQAACGEGLQFDNPNQHP
jgi:predicted nucleic acid-binding protein